MDAFNWHFDFESRVNTDSNAEPAQEPSTSRNSAPARNHQERLLDLQAESFGCEELADIEIHVGEDHVFKVNRYFLCLHSDVFSAYLNNNSVEKKTNIIQIKDLDPMFIEAMLRFMYSGRVENLKDIAHDLYIVADRYNIRILQDICLEFMFNNLDMKHIFNCLELAFQLEMEDLKQKSIEFAIKNIKQLQEQDEWVPLVKRNPDIAISLLQHLTNENEKLKAKVADLETQKCPIHHCRLPHHEMLLRHDRNRQLQRLRDQLRQNEEANEEPMRHDRYYQLIMNYIRRQRERRNLPPLEQLPVEERNAIIAQAHNDLGPNSDDDYPVRELQRANPNSCG
ncbi:Protein maternal effect lethal 26-like protein [Aphelenchoides bicaudatus]|nr:Protein maternal effect lethal 26-like protein [Aphelenchoides bicaudatus]